MAAKCSESEKEEQRRNFALYAKIKELTGPRKPTAVNRIVRKNN